jgi:hypothetical protein
MIPAMIDRVSARFMWERVVVGPIRPDLDRRVLRLVKITSLFKSMTLAPKNLDVKRFDHAFATTDSVLFRG